MAAEIGTMRVTEQIDALEIMAIDPYRFLNLPRIIGIFIALPILTVISEFVALICGAVYAHYFLNVPFSVFNYGLTHYFYAKDFFGGLVKSLFFALVIAASGCYFGFKVKGGAKEVGKATTYAVVTASILILVLDFLVALVIFG
jgi:phospholipid/cholesterol/gamma-HCH transport system permease protein